MVNAAIKYNFYTVKACPIERDPPFFCNMSKLLYFLSLSGTHQVSFSKSWQLKIIHKYINIRGTQLFLLNYRG